MAAMAKHGAKHEMHHCGGMAEEDSIQALGGIFITGNRAHPCPMNCCEQGAPKSGAAIQAISFTPSVAVTDANVHFAPISFVSAGFSSHTDRGPPTA
jgi:hypothetical protein